MRNTPMFDGFDEIQNEQAERSRYYGRMADALAQEVDEGRG